MEKYPITRGSSSRDRKHGGESFLFNFILFLRWSRLNKEGNIITTSGYHLEGYDPVDDIMLSCVKARRARCSLLPSASDSDYIASHGMMAAEE